ncbi:MAG: glycosyltransferase family A protein [Pseudomonadota bacterium]
MNQSDSHPRFTVVIPVFNAEATLSETIQSVFDQTDPSWELILVDDGSTDESYIICDMAAALDSRVRVIDNVGKGPADARNLGAFAGSGDFIAFLDADDIWTPDRLQRMAAGFAARPSAGCLFSRVRLIDAESEMEVGITPHIFRLMSEDLLGEFAITTSSNLVFRRKAFTAIDGFDPDMSAAEDQDIVLRLTCLTSWTVKGLDAVLLTYRLNTASLSAQLETMEAGWKHLIAKADCFAPLLVRSARRRASALFYRQHALRAVRGIKRPLAAMGCLARAFASSPTVLLASPLRTAKACALVLTTLFYFPAQWSHS